MVLTSAVEILTQFIQNNEVRPMKKWSLRFNPKKKNWHILAIKKKVRDILDLLSGNDTLSMLRSKNKKSFYSLNHCFINCNYEIKF